MASSFQITLLDMNVEMTDAWRAEISRRPLSIRQRIHIVTSLLTEASCKYVDCIVSPANSNALLDGEFDEAISETLWPSCPSSCTEVVQEELYQKWRGFQPTGTCMLVRIFPEATAIRYVAHVPTMRVPESIKYNQDIVYQSMWSLLAALEHHQNSASATDNIRHILMTGFGTGVGGISARQCAYQQMQALEDYEEAQMNPDKWRTFGWAQAHERCTKSRMRNEDDITRMAQMIKAQGGTKPILGKLRPL